MGNFPRFSLGLCFLCWAAFGQSIFTIAGIPPGHRPDVDGVPALNAPLYQVYGLLFDRPSGRLLFHDGNLVERIEQDGTLTALVGRGQTEDASTADGTLASYLNIFILRGMAEDSAGNLYLADAAAGRIYRVVRDGTVTTFAGGGTKPPPQSDGGPATAAQVSSPRGMVFDSKGNLDFADPSYSVIRQVSPSGIISTIYTLPTNSGFRQLEGLAIDSQDNLYVTEWLGATVFRISPSGAVTTIAGTGTSGFSGDGGPATAAQLYGPSALTIGPDGSLYIADSGNNRIRRVGPDGIISTVAGSDGEISNILFPPGAIPCSFSGDGGPALSATLCNPAQLLFDSTGSLLVADFGNARVRRIAPDGTITTIAGSGKPVPTIFPDSGDGGQAITATFNHLAGALYDSAGNLYVSEGNRIRKIAPDGIITPFAGNGQTAYSGDGGPALQASFSGVGPIAFDPKGSLYVITGDSRVRKITPDGIVHLFAGSGTGTGLDRSQGDGGPAVNATLNEPGGVAFDAAGNTYIADTSNARLRKIDPNGIITTIAGPGQLGVDYYNDVAVDPQGNVYLAWTHALLYPRVTTAQLSGMILRVNPDGTLTPVVGNGVPCTSGPFGSQFAYDGMPALQAQLCEVTAFEIDKNGVMYLPYGGQVLKVTTDGIIHVVAGNALATAPGDGGPPLAAGFGNGPGLPTFDPQGNMVIPQVGFDRLREITSTPYQLSLSMGSITATGTQSQSWKIATSANFQEPFPYSVRVSTNDGASWITVNRTTALVGEPFIVTVNPANLAPGNYRGAVTVATAGGVSQQVTIAVTLTVPAK